ncbi:hypothetical protein [Streptomyces sp. NPDC048508]|uniref:hypothetical protein n=1 Tax=Streptomyces sp. NPDC048508 TaxID=3365561 RepID=UPI003717A61B
MTGIAKQHVNFRQTLIDRSTITVPSAKCGPACQAGRFISGKDKQNAVKTMVLTDQNGRMLCSSRARQDITHASQLGLVKLMAGGPEVEILADAGYQGLRSQTDRRVVTPPHRKFK